VAAGSSLIPRSHRGPDPARGEGAGRGGSWYPSCPAASDHPACAPPPAHADAEGRPAGLAGVAGAAEPESDDGSDYASEGEPGGEEEEERERATAQGAGKLCAPLC
jgi:hypothetical protein